MKTCPKCGERFASQIDFCFYDGAVLASAAAAPTEGALDAPPAPGFGGTEPRTRRRRSLIQAGAVPSTLVPVQSAEQAPTVASAEASLPRELHPQFFQPLFIKPKAPPASAPPRERGPAPAAPVEPPAAPPVAGPQEPVAVETGPAEEPDGWFGDQQPPAPVDEEPPPKKSVLPLLLAGAGAVLVLVAVVGVVALGVVGGGSEPEGPPSLAVASPAAPPPGAEPRPGEGPAAALAAPSAALPAGEEAEEAPPGGGEGAAAPPVEAAPPVGEGLSEPSAPSEAGSGSPGRAAAGSAAPRAETPVPAAPQVVVNPTSEDRGSAAPQAAPAAPAERPEPPPAASNERTFVITSDPPGAALSLNGQPKGATPVTLTLRFGTYSAVLQKEGHDRVVERLTVGTDTEDVSFSLGTVKEEITNKVMVVLPGRDGDSLMVDGRPVGALPAQVMLSEGDHVFVIEGGGGVVKVEKRVVFTGNYTVVNLGE